MQTLEARMHAFARQSVSDLHTQHGQGTLEPSTSPAEQLGVLLAFFASCSTLGFMPSPLNIAACMEWLEVSS